MEAAKLDILIEIQAKLDGLLKVNQGLRDAKQEASTLGGLLRQGLGIGTGIELARRGLDLMKATISASVGEAFRMAGALKDASQNLGITAEALQVLTEHVEDNGAQMQTLTTAIVNYRGQLSQVQSGNAEAAKTFRDMGLSADALSRLPLEQQLEKLARAIFRSGNETEAFDSAVKILGRQNAPRLMQSLRELADRGYGDLSTAMKEAGRVMSDDTIERLDRAQKSIEKFRKFLTIQTGETIGFWSQFVESLSRDPLGTAGAAARAPLYWMGLSSTDSLGQKFGQNASSAASAGPKGPAMADTESILLARLQFVQEELARTNDAAMSTEIEKRPKILSLLQSQEDLYVELVRLRYSDLDALTATSKLALEQSLAEGKVTQEQLARLQERAKLEATINGIRSQQRAAGGEGPSAFKRTREAFNGTGDSSVNSSFMTAGEGVFAGAMQWSTQLGSAGEQIASSLQGSIGTAVDGISTGISGWITGTQSWGDSLRGIGQSILQTMLNTIVQMGVQMALSALLGTKGMISMDAVGDALRAKRIAATAAEGTAAAASNAPGAVAASISSFGAAAAIGIIALIAAMSAFGGFKANGGAANAGTPYVVGDGGRPEMFVPSSAGRIVPSFQRSSPGIGSSSIAASARPQRDVWVVGDLFTARQMARDPEWDTMILDSVRRNRGDLLNS